ARTRSHRISVPGHRPRSRAALGLGVAGTLLAVLAGCTPGRTFDVQGVQTHDLDRPQTVYYSNPASGFSARLTGPGTGTGTGTGSRAGTFVTRDLWVFCDSGGFDSTGAPFGG